MFFFFNDTATTEIYTLSLHDALPIFKRRSPFNSKLITHNFPDHPVTLSPGYLVILSANQVAPAHIRRSEEHTSELQSRQYLVCRLLLEKKKNYNYNTILSN